VKLGITYTSQFAYLADGCNGLRVVQLTSPETPGNQGFSPRPTRIKNVRKLTYTGSGEYVINGAGQVEARVWLGHFGSEFENSDQLSIDVTQDYELLHRPFTPSPRHLPPTVR